MEDGKIIANGTEDEKVTFSSINDGVFYNISIQSENDKEQSFFRYVDFFGFEMINDGGGMASNKSLFFNTALAAEYSFSNVLSYSSGKVHIENSTFYNANINADSYIEEGDENGFIEIVNSNFEFNHTGIALDSNISCYKDLPDSDCKKHIFLKNNWYGNDEGDSFDIIGFASGKYFIDGWRANKLIADPVVIVPGIMGSTEVLGKWKLDPILHVYDDLVASFEKNGYEENKNFFRFPYNWRKSNVQTAIYLKEAINVMKNTTKVSKVDVVAHSMGGLVARSYIESDDYENDVDQFVTVATPHHGSPESYLKWTAGEGFLTFGDWIARRHFENEANHMGYSDLQKYIQDKIVSVKELLPDYDYLFDVSKDKMRNYPDNYPENNFLEELNKNENISKLKKVNFINIIGETEGIETITKIKVIKSGSEDKWKYGIPENFNSKNTNRGLERGKGDKTVPLYSAETITSNKEIKIDSSHQEIPKKAQCDIIKNLTGKIDCQYVNNWHITNILLLDVFSPVDIQVISPSGKRIGKNFNGGENFNEINGAFYTGFDTDNEFVTIPDPEKGKYNVIAQGTGNGEYKIKVAHVSEDENETLETEEIFEGNATNGNSDKFDITVEENKASDSDETNDNGNSVIVLSNDDSDDSKHKKSDNKNNKKKKESKKIEVAVAVSGSSNVLLSQIIADENNKKNIFSKIGNQSAPNNPVVKGVMDENTETEKEEIRNKFNAILAILAVIFLLWYLLKNVKIMKYFKKR